MADQRTLNTQQLEAIHSTDGPLLIIAGAGTGKTTVVTERIKHLILDKNVSPSQILALTFTEKAAKEMEERVDIVMPYGYSQTWIATFHAFCDRILRNEAIHIGLNPAYKLMTEAETILFLRKNINTFSLKYFRPLGNPNKFLEGLIQHFSRLRDEDITPEQYLTYAKKMEKDMTNELAHAFSTYEKLKAKTGMMDFSDLITNTLKLFRTRKNILKNYQEQFHYILVDEFQDTNFAQNQLAIMLSGKRKNIAVVGDDDQAIYRWRGAAISNIIQFRTHFPQAKIVTLTQNYRSTQEILNKSYDLIQFNNPDRLEAREHVDKKLKATRDKKGIPIELFFAPRAEDEAELVVKKIIELVEEKKYFYKDFAILVRANDHAQSFVRILQNHGVPYQFLGPGRLFQQEEIKDIIAYLKVLENFEDATSLYRVLTMPTFSLYPRDIAAILNYGKRKNLQLFETMEKIAEGQNDILLRDETKEKIQKIVTMIKNHLKRVPIDSAGQILYYFLKDSGIMANMLLPTQTVTDEKKFQNIAKFFDKLKSFEVEHEQANVFTVVEWIDLAMQMGESPLATDIDWSDNNAVNILTIHSSKGLEFSVVFLVNLVNQRFPTRERHEQIPIPSEIIKEILPEGDYHLQEERRLFYVGMTRARDQLFLTAANYYGEGKRERKFSPFIAEALGQEYIDKVLKREKVKNTVVQPSLLDWIEGANKKTDPTLIDTQTQQSSNPVTYLSYSQIQCFNMCPLHYKLRYIYKVPTFPSPAQSFGISIHATLRDYFQKILRGEKISPNTIQSLLNTVWIDEGYGSKSDEQSAKQKAITVLEKYIKSMETIANPVALEIPFKFFLNDTSIKPQGIQFAGRIDRVDKLTDDTIEIIDYKTGSNMPDEKKLKSDLQLTAYALAAVEVHDNIFNKKPEQVKLSLHYLEEETMLSTTRTIDQLEEAKTTILQKALEIEKSDFLCNGSLFCKNCEYKMLCHT